MIFIGRPDLPSVRLRGKQVAEAIGARFSDRVGNARDEAVVFVKVAARHEVEKAKSRGCVVAYDILDFLCYQDREISFADLVDFVIVPNAKAWAHYILKFPNAEALVIPHHWDVRLREANLDSPKVGYIGMAYNMPTTKNPYLAMCDEENMVRAASQFNIHICVSKRNGLSQKLKPATKLAVAAGVGAVAIVYRDDASAAELLPDEYPFFVDEDLDATIEKAISSFGKLNWLRAKKVMNDLKGKLHVAEVGKKYLELEAIHA